MALATTKPLLLTDLLSHINSDSSIPSNYIRAEPDRPNLLDVEIADRSIPIIDLNGCNRSDRNDVVKAIGLACQNDGFFQVKNHGIPNSVIRSMLQVSKEFFQLPESERMKSYSDDPMKTTRLSTSFNINTEKVCSWRDYLRLHCYPPEDFVHEWPLNPRNFREVVAEYCEKVRELILWILEAISESLGLDADYLNHALGDHGQHMAINYYPPCPQPELTYGLPGHKDPNVITVLLQENGVSGLQVMRHGKWVAIGPDAGALIVNAGDQLQVLSNDRYKSVLHRAIVNKSASRISIATFYCPSANAIIKPSDSLVDDEHHPAIYRSYTYAEYYDKFWNHGLNSESCLDMFKITQ